MLKLHNRCAHNSYKFFDFAVLNTEDPKLYASDKLSRPSLSVSYFEFASEVPTRSSLGVSYFEPLSITDATFMIRCGKDKFNNNEQRDSAPTDFDLNNFTKSTD